MAVGTVRMFIEPSANHRYVNPFSVDNQIARTRSHTIQGHKRKSHTFVVLQACWSRKEPSVKQGRHSVSVNNYLRALVNSSLIVNECMACSSHGPAEKGTRHTHTHTHTDATH